MKPPTTPKQVRAFPGLVGYYRKFIRGFAKIAKLLTPLTRQQVKFNWTPEHHEAFLYLKEAIVQAPILHYPNPNKTYIVYTDASDDACRAHLSQEHNQTEFPVAFLSHTFTETQCKWSTTEQEAFGVYCATTKWNYYLQGADIIVQNDHKPLVQFLNGKNTNNKVNRWSLELATYNISFEWISGAKNKAMDCLSRLVTSTTTSINMLTASFNDGPAFNTRSCTQSASNSTSALPTDAIPHLSQDATATTKSLTADCLDALLQMQRIDPFCTCISKRLLNGKAPHHEFDTFTHVKGLLYKHVSDAGKKFLTLVIPKSWKFTILVEAHDKLGHQGNSCTYCLIKHQYYWKGMNKDIRKYIANCVLCRWDKPKVQQCHDQDTDTTPVYSDSPDEEEEDFPTVPLDDKHWILEIVPERTFCIHENGLPNNLCQHPCPYGSNDIVLYMDSLDLSDILDYEDYMVTSSHEELLGMEEVPY